MGYTQDKSHAIWLFNPSCARTQKSATIKNSHDFSLFYRTVEDCLIILVDDILITGDSHEDIIHITSSITIYKLMDFGEFKYFLGIEVLKSGSSFCCLKRNM